MLLLRGPAGILVGDDVTTSREAYTWPRSEARQRNLTGIVLYKVGNILFFLVPKIRLYPTVQPQAGRSDGKLTAVSRKQSVKSTSFFIGGGQEFVIGGYTPAPKNFDAILVGYYEGKKLLFASKVRTGFVPASRESLFRNFEKLRTEACPFANLPETKKGHWGEGLTATGMEKCIWLEPRLIAVIDYAEWTPANHLRHAKFIGLREDKNPREVTRDRPI